MDETMPFYFGITLLQHLQVWEVVGVESTGSTRV